MDTFFDKFKINHEKEDLQAVIVSIENGVVFKGTNLWILIFAIFVASLGLNVNSTAVIIGAMLISPLMGPIMGIGLAMGMSDIRLLRKSIYNFTIATLVALATSTLFFLISPLNEAYSELLARTTPNIYDVLIALFGGLAGTVATFSKQKGNVIPGVAIATALMPPLCTAGYGLATFQFNFFFGAFYLFIINTVFIALATFIIARVLHFPLTHLQDARADRIARGIVTLIVISTLLPSIYFGYDVVQQNRFTKNANQFITNEAHFPNDYLLKKDIDAKAKKITLVFGGKKISSEEIDLLKDKLKKYNLATALVEVKQGFAYLSETGKNDQADQLSRALALEEQQGNILQAKMDSIGKEDIINNQIYAEIKSQYPAIESAIIQKSKVLDDSLGSKNVMLIVLTSKSRLSEQEKKKMEKWLQIRMNNPDLQLIFRQ